MTGCQVWVTEKNVWQAETGWNMMEIMYYSLLEWIGVCVKVKVTKAYKKLVDFCKHS